MAIKLRHVELILVLSYRWFVGPSLDVANELGYAAPSKVTWEGFRERYESEKLAGLAPRTKTKALGVFNAIEEFLNPEKLREITTAKISFFTKKLRDKGLSEHTVAGMLAHLQAALRWAERIGMITKAPAIERPCRANRSL